MATRMYKPGFLFQLCVEGAIWAGAMYDARQALVESVQRAC
jgi:hypothetical protein